MLEVLANILDPYKDLVGTIAGTVTIAQFFAGVFICKDIRDRKSTRGISAIPFVGGIVISIAMLKYATILGDAMMTTVNYVALALNLCYVIFYFTYSGNKMGEIIIPSAIGATLNTILLLYTQWESPDNLEYRYGFIMTVLMLALLGAPLVGVKEIIEKEDASSIPFVLTLMGTIVTFSWLLYSIILRNSFMLCQNAAGLLLTTTQLYLIFKYPGKPKVSKEKKAE